MKPINRRHLPPQFIKPQRVKSSQQLLILLVSFSPAKNKKMSCCGGNCGCGSSCKCGNGCGGCKMYSDLAGERGTAAAAVVDFGAATQKGQLEGFEMEAGFEGGSCDCTKCKCGTSCSCACCSCN